MIFDEAKLTRWSRLVRIRDQAACQMCRSKPGVFQLEAHHIYPKHLPQHEDKCYNLDNGIALCERCHMQVVHSSETNWRRFTAMFKAYLDRKTVKTYNVNKQGSL